MALWQGSQFNSTESAMVVNKIANRKAIAIVQRGNPLLYKLIGKTDPVSVHKGMTKTERSENITGKNYEVRLLGSLLPTTKVADGAEELATATQQFDPNQFGSAEFALSHYTFTQSFPSSQLFRFKGDEAKTADFIDEQFGAVMLSYEKDMGRDLNSDGGAAAVAKGATPNTVVVGRKQFGSWLFAVSTGGGTGGADATGENQAAFRNYGTIDRQDPANADFRGVVSAATGAVTLKTLRAYRNLVSDNEGLTDTVLAGQVLYTKLEDLIEQSTRLEVDNGQDRIEFGGISFRYAGMDVLLDTRCPDGTIGGLDSRWWTFLKKAEDMTKSGIIVHPGATAAHVLITEMWAQLVCKRPNAQFKLLGCT